MSSVARTLRRNNSRIEHAEGAADEHRIADIGDRGPHQVALVVDLRDLDAGRGRLSQFRQQLVEPLGDRQGIAPQAAEDGYGHGVLAVRADPRGAVFVGNNGAAHVGHADRLAVDLRQHELIQVGGLLGLAVQEHLELQRSLVQAAHGAEAVVFAHAVGHVGNREAGRHQPLRVDFHDDLADVAALDGYVGDVVDAFDPGAEVVIGIIVQARRIASAGHDEGDDREDRRRLPLDERAGAGRELGVDVGDLGPHVVQGLHHFGAGRELDVDLRRPATDFERTWRTPSTVPTASSMGRVREISIVVTARPGDWAMTVIRGKATSG